MLNAAPGCTQIGGEQAQQDEGAAGASLQIKHSTLHSCAGAIACHFNIRCNCVSFQQQVQLCVTSAGMLQCRKRTTHYITVNVQAKVPLSASLKHPRQTCSPLIMPYSTLMLYYDCTTQLN